MPRREPLLLALALGTVLAGAEQESLRSAFASSYAAEAAGELEAAERFLANEAEARPGNYLLHLRLGWLALRRSEARLAEQRYRIAALIAPRSLEAKLGLAEALMLQQRRSQARSEVYGVLEVEPGNVAARQLLVRLLLADGLPRSAEDMALRLVADYPADAGCAALLAQVRAARPAPPSAAVAATTTPPAAADPSAPSVWFTPEAGVWAYSGATTRQWTLMAGLAAGVAWPEVGEATVGVERSQQSYRRTPDFAQTDLNLVLGRWIGPVRVQGGLHAIQDDAHGWSAGRTVLAGTWWQLVPWLGLGCDGSWSRFEVVQPVTAVEVIPRLAAWQELGAGWSAGAEVHATVIDLDQPLGQGRGTLNASGFKVWAARAGWSVALGGWSGDRMYHVAPGGSAVYDLAARYRGGWDLTIGRAWNRWSATVTGGRERFSETWSSAGADAIRFVLTTTVTF